MFKWLKLRSKRPSDPEMVARIIRVLDAFVQKNGIEEFTRGQLSLIVKPDYQVAIAEASSESCLVEVALNDFKFPVLTNAGFSMDVLQRDSGLAIVAFDHAARSVVQRLPP